MAIETEAHNFMRLRARIEQLETKHVCIARAVKQMLPGWLLKEFVKQGARLDANGRLDLSLLHPEQNHGGAA